MSIYAIVWAYQQDLPGAGAKFTLVTAAQYANEHGVCWVGQETLAADMSMTVRSVRRHLADLEKAKYIERVERRRKDGTRTSDLIKLIGFKRTNIPADTDQADKNDREQPDNFSGHETSVKETSVNDSSLRSESADDSSADVKPESPGQYYNRVLSEAIADLRELGFTIHSPTDPERKDFGAMFKAAVKDGYEIPMLDHAIEYQVQKAAGLVEREAPAWCGFRTALDRVVAGDWEPYDPELDAKEVERERSRDRRFEGYEWLKDRDEGSEPAHMTDREAKRALEEMREALGGPDDE